MAKTKDNRQGSATRQRLIKIAEKLFALHGVDGVSVRAINAAAGLGPASIHYHFGSKADLLEAVLEDLGGAVREQITDRIAQLTARAEPASAHELVEALTAPYLGLLIDRPLRGIRWVKIVAAVANSDSAEAEPPDLGAAIRAELHRSFPGADQELLGRRWAMALTAYLQTLGHIEHWVPIGPGKDPGELREFHADLVAYTAGGFLAAAGRSGETPAGQAAARPQKQIA